jgi:hypothetical protein
MRPESPLLPDKASKSETINCQEEDMLLLKSAKNAALSTYNPFHLMSYFFVSIALIQFPK